MRESNKTGYDLKENWMSKRMSPAQTLSNIWLWCYGSLKLAVQIFLTLEIAFFGHFFVFYANLHILKVKIFNFWGWQMKVHLISNILAPILSRLVENWRVQIFLHPCPLNRSKVRDPVIRCLQCVEGAVNVHNVDKCGMWIGAESGSFYTVCVGSL